jgi:hypothetical protein
MSNTTKDFNMLTVIVLDGTKPDALKQIFKRDCKTLAEATAYARRMTSGIGARPCAQIWNGDTLLEEVNSAARKRWLLGVCKWAIAA